MTAGFVNCQMTSITSVLVASGFLDSVQGAITWVRTHILSRLPLPIRTSMPTVVIQNCPSKIVNCWVYSKKILSWCCPHALEFFSCVPAKFDIQIGIQQKMKGDVAFIVLCLVLSCCYIFLHFIFRWSIVTCIGLVLWVFWVSLERRTAYKWKQ